MTRLFSRLLVTAMALAFISGASAFAATSTSAPMTSSTHKKHSCPAGETWVKGYTKSNGQHVKGYCRKSPSSTTH